MRWVIEVLVIIIDVGLIGTVNKVFFVIAG